MFVRWSGAGEGWKVFFFLPKLHIVVPKLAFWGDFIIVRYHFPARKLKSTLKPSKNIVWSSKTTMFEKNVLASRQCFLMVLTCSWVSWPKNDAERIWNHLKKPVLDPKCAKFDQKSGFWRLVSVSCGWGKNPQGGSGGTQMGQAQYSPLRNCIRPL